MKNLFIKGTLCALVCAQISCKKEDVLLPSSNRTSSEIVYGLDNIPIINNAQDINHLITYTTDNDEEKLNRYLYEIGLATRDLIKNVEFNALIINMALESNNEVVYLLDLKTVSPIFYNTINDKLALKGLSLEYISENMTHKPISGNPIYPETMEIEKYEPAIFIPNLKIIDPNRQPLLSPNIETDCNENEAIEDFVVTWYYTTDGVLNEIILGEETSLSTSNPLFFIDHASSREIENSVAYSSRPSEEMDRGFLDITEFRSETIDIKHGYGYEPIGTSKSEFSIVATYTSSGFPSNFVFMGTPDHSFKIREIAQTDFGTDFSVNSYVSPNYVPTYGLGGFKVFWNTFERDWNRSEKSLGYALNVLGAPGTNDDTYLNGRRRYEEDWYAWSPATLPIHELPISWYSWLTEIDFDNWKSQIVIRSVE